MNYICWTRPNSIFWSVLREIRAHGSDRGFWSLEIVYGRNFGQHCLRIRATNIKCSWPHYKFTWTFQMSVQFLEARACQRHDLGEPVFGDGVLSMIVVPRRFTPCDNMKDCSFKKKKRAVDFSNYELYLGNIKSQFKNFFQKVRFHPNAWLSFPILLSMRQLDLDVDIQETIHPGVWCHVDLRLTQANEFYCEIVEQITMQIILLIGQQIYHVVGINVHIHLILVILIYISVFMEINYFLLYYI